MKTKSLTKESMIVAGTTITVALYLAALAAPYISPTLRAHQLDNSAQEVVNFLEQARTQSVVRNAPAVCRVEIDGSRTILTLDWNFNGTKSVAPGDQLVLHRGVVLMQNGVPQKSGVLASFNPRGGAVYGSAEARSGKLLSLAHRGGAGSELREIDVTAGGDFEVNRGHRLVG